MSCDEFNSMITPYLDNELPPERRAFFESHLASCERCRRELEEFRKLKEELDMIRFKEPTDAELDRYWHSVYNRLERGIGWALFSVGASQSRGACRRLRYRDTLRLAAARTAGRSQGR